jgi:hypothetical protein
MQSSQNHFHNFLHTFTMAWGVKTGFTFALHFFLLISDGLGGVHHLKAE